LATRVSAFWLHQACNSICMKGGSKIDFKTFRIPEYDGDTISFL